MKLTDRQISAFPLSESRKQYSDDAVSGLSLRIGKTAKTFQLVIGGGANRKRFTLGHYPTISLAAARERARDIIAKERLNPDEAPRTTFEEALETYYRVHLSALRQQSRKAKRNALDRNFRPALGKCVLADIKRRDLPPLLDAMSGTPVMQHTAFCYLASFFNWAVRRGYLDTAPTDRLEPPRRPESRDRVLTPEELTAIWHAAPESDYGRIVKLCILSGQRRHQWATIRHDYITGDTITWPSEIMKEGKAHTLPLTPRMAALLPTRIGYLFPRENGTPFSNWTRHKDRLTAMSMVADFRLHDFRRTLATVMAEQLHIQPHIIEAVLAHASGSTVQRTYNRATYLPQMREALSAFDDWFFSRLEGVNRLQSRQRLQGTVP